MEKAHYRFYIRTRACLGEKPTEIHRDLVKVYGSQAVSYSTVCRWSQSSEQEEMDLEDKPRIGRPVTQTTQENIEWVRALIEADPHSTYADIQAETLLSNYVIEGIIHKHLKMRKITSRWVPHELTSEQKQKRVKFCQENLEHIRSGSWRLGDIVTGDETWIYFRQIGRKASHACWISEGQSPPTIARRSRNEEKRLFSIFFKANGWLHVHYLNKGQTLNYSYYVDNCLKPVTKVLWEQRPNSGPKGLKLLHDNARPHTKPETIDYVKAQGMQLMPHPPYSPDLAPCDYWLNSYIKSHLEDQNDEDSLLDAVAAVLNSIPIEEYRKTFEKLRERMQRCIDNKGGYFEHLM